MKHCKYCDEAGGYPLFSTKIPGYDLDAMINEDFIEVKAYKEGTADIVASRSFRIRYCPICGRDLIESIMVGE